MGAPSSQVVFVPVTPPPAPEPPPKPAEAEVLEHDVRGQIGAHHAFWRGITRDQFVAKKVFGKIVVVPGKLINIVVK